MNPPPSNLLHDIFGFHAFRGKQTDVIDRIMAGQNTLAVMPTGAGKSLCYQYPAVALDGTVVVISPLIALMHDQLRAAEAVGIRAATLTSADSNREESIRRFLDGELDLLYVAPERASGAGFKALLEQAKIALFAIDEAHCVSEWGHDFRPDYRLLRPLLDSFPHVPRLALTATADTHTRADILAQLGIVEDGLIIAGFDRPNIRYHLSPRNNGPKQIVDLLRQQSGPGIIYVQSRAATEKLAGRIAAAGRDVRIYHAGLAPDIRATNQAEFVASEDMVMVATIAFGMGIDKPDVRFVAHMGLPKSIEAYYQETGRAGRDGDPAEAHLFWGASDFALARQRLGEIEPARREAERARLNSLASLVETTECRRAILLRHFGEKPPATCGNCDNCLNPPDSVDASMLAQKLLSAVHRTGHSFGIGHIEAVLTGKSDDRIVARGHDALSVFNIVGGDEARLIRPLARTLLVREALVQTEHGGLAFGPAARAMLRGEDKIALILPPLKKKEKRARANAAMDPADAALFEALRAKRRELASEADVPPYVIFHDSTLREMAQLRPGTLSALGEVSGVGTRKLESWGPAFLEVLTAFA